MRSGLALCGLSLILALVACRTAPQPAASPTPAVNPLGNPGPVLPPSATPRPTETPTPANSATPTATSTPVSPLAIEYMRRQTYPGSELTIEETLEPGANYDRYLVSYRSDGLKIYALMTVPKGEKPGTGWPVVVFNHGYIPPAQYRPTERYIAYVDAFALSGYIVFRPDYRGHGNSEGRATGAFTSADYTVDVLNAVSTIKGYQDADPKRIGMWGHSMGGGITLRAMVVEDDIKAGVIWAGTVGPYQDLLRRWSRAPAPGPGTPAAGPRVNELTAQYGPPEANPKFWSAISPNAYLADLSGPVQLHHGTADESVPLEYSEALYAQIEAVGKTVELYTYSGDNHNISNNLAVALQRSVAFFDRHVKGATAPG